MSDEHSPECLHCLLSPLLQAYVDRYPDQAVTAIGAVVQMLAEFIAASTPDQSYATRIGDKTVQLFLRELEVALKTSEGPASH